MRPVSPFRRWLARARIRRSSWSAKSLQWRLGVTALEDRLVPAAPVAGGGSGGPLSGLAAFCPGGDCNALIDPLLNDPTICGQVADTGFAVATDPNSVATDRSFNTRENTDPFLKGTKQQIQPNVCAGPYGNLPSLLSTGPVRYADGVISFSSTDIASDGFGAPFSQTRSWSNNPSYAAAADSANGNGWVDSWLPGLVEVGSSSPDTLAVVSNGTTARFFDYTGGAYHERFFGQDVLTHDDTNHQYDLTTPQGMTFKFGDFSSGTPTNEQGRFAGRTDAYGNLTRVFYNSDGQVSEVVRGGGVESSDVTESWLYTYLDSSDPNAGLLASVTLRRGPDCGGPPWSTVRVATYTCIPSRNSFRFLS
jgi:YD repeat-containing protein